MNSRVKIWSFEHNAWWKPNEWGYTPNVHEAGTYSRERAEQIVTRANMGGINEQIVELYGAAPEKESIKMDVTLTDTLQNLCAAGIAHGIECTGYGGWKAWVGTHVDAKKFNPVDLKNLALWMQNQAVVLYPNSQFSAWLKKEQS